ncbi:hypothetical protein ACNKHW_03215 [Shigella flexneri]
MTNHHQNSQPQSMQRIAGANVSAVEDENSMPTGAATSLYSHRTR